MYNYVLNSVVKVSMMYFEYYTITLRAGAFFFVDTLYY